MTPYVVFAPRWRKRLFLPLLAFPAARHSKLARPPRPAPLHILLAAPFLFAISSLAVSLLSSAPPSLFSAGTILSGRRADPRAIELARLAVHDLLYPPPDRLPPALFADDRENFRLLVSAAHIPPVFASRLGPGGRRTLLRRLTLDSNGMLVFEAMPRVLIVDLQNGLGNRLRALGSALEFAFYTHRVLVVLWAPDAHINATMADLFAPSLLRNIIVINTPVAWPIDPTDCFAALAPNFTAIRLPVGVPAATFRFFSFMDKDADFRASSNRIANVAGKHIYVKTAYVLNSKWTRDNLINPFIQALRPAPRVLELVRHVEDRAGGPVALSTMVGVHIRSRSIVQDNDAVDPECEYSIRGAAVTDSWRQMSTPKQFIPEMHRIRGNWPSVVRSSYALTPAQDWSASSAIAQANSDLGGGPAVPVDLDVPPRFYVSTDSVETVKQLYSDFEREDIVYLPRNCDDRGTACIVYAFADIIVLSRTGALLASGWSSFSEAAARLRVRPFGMDPSRNDGYFLRISGVDFGAPSLWDNATERWKRILRFFRFVATEKTNAKTMVTQEARLSLCRQQREQGVESRTSIT